MVHGCQALPWDKVQIVLIAVAQAQLPHHGRIEGGVLLVEPPRAVLLQIETNVPHLLVAPHPQGEMLAHALREDTWCVAGMTASPQVGWQQMCNERGGSRGATCLHSNFRIMNIKSRDKGFYAQAHNRAYYVLRVVPIPLVLAERVTPCLHQSSS